MYPETRTVLDIGGQDTKAIQVDPHGIVESFQMNDRCAAGCGRYLGYIADEMNMGLHELGPAGDEVGPSRCASTRPAPCSPAPSCATGCRSAKSARTSWPACTAPSSCARCRSSRARAACTDEFTFTGGVAKNEAAVRELRKLVKENYGEVTININPDSIYTGALGAARIRAPRASTARWTGAKP